MKLMHLCKAPLYRILIVICLVCVIALMLVSWLWGDISRTETAEPVHIIGKYSVDGGEAQELTGDTAFDSEALHTVRITGHFSPAIPEGWVLMLRLDNIRATIRVNGAVVYSFGGEDSVPAFSKSAGSTWGFYISPGITEADEVEITLQNVYAGTVTNVFEAFLKDMSYGHGFELYQTMMRDKLPSILLGFVIFVTGAIAFVICAVAKLFKAHGMGRGMALACVTIAGGMWILIDGGYPYVSLLFDNPLLFNTIDVLQIFVISVVLVIFTFTCLESKTARKIAEIISNVSLALLIAAVVAQLSGVYDLYEIQNWAIAIGFCVALISIMLLGYEALLLKHRQVLFILLSWLPLFLSGFLEVLNYYIRFMPERTAIQYGFALSVLLQFVQLVRAIRGNIGRMQKAIRLEYELLQSRMAVMLSQIQPHFLFNTLNDIRFLYRESPVQAEEALVSFTRYLRGNMDSLNQTDLVPFEQELNHVNNYIAIEKIRFGGRLNVDFDINCTRFFVPVLTVQPLVENAIRHGVMKKREGGTVIIRTFEDAHDYVIEVRDDGAGFDPSSPQMDGRTHNGIHNVRMRLQSMCGGSMVIESHIGEGTSSLVRIPKE